LPSYFIREGIAREVVMRRVAVVAALAAALSSACAGPGLPRPAGETASWGRERFLRAHPPTGTPTAEPASFGKRVGALFSHDTKGDHFCTASAVDSPGRNLIITAAHCVHSGRGGGYLGDLVFVPGYRHGAAPYGIWKIKAQFVDPRWAANSDPDLDVGFAVVDPLGGRNIEDVLGSNLLGIDQGFTNLVRVTGYPKSSDQPVTCINRTTRELRYQMRFACKGYAPGTSGSPWLTHYDPATKRGEVVGVIGGYQLGGLVDAVSYSAYFDDDVRELYERAIRGVS
jgi:V8-like Glu-specific endopeptidase